jgi:hypothetical protein
MQRDYGLLHIKNVIKRQQLRRKACTVYLFLVIFGHGLLKRCTLLGSYIIVLHLFLVKRIN